MPSAGLRNRGPINQAAGELRLRPHGIFYVFMVQITESADLHCRSLLQYVSKGVKKIKRVSLGVWHAIQISSITLRLLSNQLAQLCW